MQDQRPSNKDRAKDCESLVKKVGNMIGQTRTFPGLFELALITKWSYLPEHASWVMNVAYTLPFHQGMYIVQIYGTEENFRFHGMVTDGMMGTNWEVHLRYNNGFLIVDNNLKNIFVRIEIV